ncbi:alanine racemase [Citrobacter freundii]|nr:alanine racemase [Citrobacter freundii]
MQAATVVINRRALRHNLQRLRELAPASKLVAVVKANAYGHGLLETARTLPDADAFGVARLEEALRLRAEGSRSPSCCWRDFLMPPICRLFPRSVCIQPSITRSSSKPWKQLIWLNPLPSG